jgi:hypothetical protein
MEMKKIISVCLCICLMSGCGKSLSHGSPVNSVVEDTGSEAPPSLTSNDSAFDTSVQIGLFVVIIISFIYGIYSERSYK